MMSNMTQQDKQWRAEDDARIIAQYMEIMEDKERLKLASEVAKKQVEELGKRINAMKKVIKKGEK